MSQLNHPHICTLYDVGEQDGIAYLVMEYIEGETLAEALKSGALPVEAGVGLVDLAHPAGRPELLFEGQYDIEPFGADASNYDVSNDAQRFIMIGNAEQSQRINVVLNWFDELERRVPTP